MFVMKRIAPIFLFLLFAFETTSWAAPPALRGFPKASDEIGDSFVTAWMALRRDMDTLAHGRVHPALLDSWLSFAPRFVAMDCARLSSEPQVILAAASRIAIGAGDNDRLFLKDLEKAHRDSPLALHFLALRIRAKDRGATRDALDDLDDPLLRVRTRAAAALLTAGDRRGISVLKDALRSAGIEEMSMAARAIGRFAGHRDADLLEDALADSPGNSVLLAAQGEFFMRRVFPNHHRMLVRRDPRGVRLVVTGGLYDEWFEIVRTAIEQGVESPQGMLSFMRSLRHEAPAGDKGEVRRRRLKSLEDFWTGVDGLVMATGPRPRWPATFEEAMSSIRTGATARADPDSFIRRVSATISVLSEAGKRLGHDRLGAFDPELRALSPNVGRANDGNLATSWMGTVGQQMVVEMGSTRPVKEIWLANSCADEPGPRIRRIEIIASDGVKKWKTEKKLGANTRYFQRVRLKGRSARRLSITISSIDGNGPACISELRVR